MVSVQTCTVDVSTHPTIFEYIYLYNPYRSGEEFIIGLENQCSSSFTVFEQRLATL